MPKSACLPPPGTLASMRNSHELAHAILGGQGDQFLGRQLCVVPTCADRADACQSVLQCALDKREQQPLRVVPDGHVALLLAAELGPQLVVALLRRRNPFEVT